ncbi:MAG TPA: HAMP domain-containing sensor histidine kinase [Candidatus Limnocylindria bacterium]
MPISRMRWRPPSLARGVAAPATEVERFESTFNRVRLAGGVIVVLSGPLFPNIGVPYVVALGLVLFAHCAAVAGLMRSDLLQRHPETLARVFFAVDTAIVSYGILVFAKDPGWTAYIVGTLLVIGGGFRFGPLGAFAAAIAMSATYVAIAIYRGSAFGYVTEPERMAFVVVLFLLEAFLVSGILREIETLRAQRDAFERQKAETEALRELDRAKSDFLAAMSHEFRSPLTVIRGTLELLLSQQPGPLATPQQELARRAQRNVLRLEDFTAELLEMARLEQGGVQLDREDVDAYELLREVVEDHRPLAQERRQSVSVEVDDNDGVISADATRFRHVLDNLVSNAIKYAPEASPITVRAARRNGSLEISVIDRGAGVAPADRERIFEKFTRLRPTRATPGAGLGLAIARSLVELHGGTLRYEDADGGGASFIVDMPTEDA